MSAALAESPVIVAQAGVYDGMPEDVYLRDPVAGGSLSCSGAKKLLPPSCPAKFRYELEHPAEPSEAMQLGSAAHKMVLGAGPDIKVVPFDAWRTNEAKAQRDEAREAGLQPMLAPAYERVAAIAEAVRQHPLASRLFDPGRGKPEQSLFWDDPEFGITRRCRLDWLPEAGGGRLIIPDFKTCTSADPGAISRSVANFSYHMQEDWYVAGVQAIFPGADVAFVFVFQETEPPYLVSVVQLRAEDVAAGHRRNRRAMEIYRDCVAANSWPDHQPDGDITMISLPRWAREDYL
jgi:hypothetical protein